MLGVRTEQDTFRLVLERSRQQRAEEQTEVEELLARIEALDARSVLDGDKSAEAERLYTRTTTLLRDIRARLYSALRELREDSAVPRPGDDPVAELDDGREGVDALRDELSESASEILTIENRQRAEHAEQLSNDLGSLNDGRLRLLDLAGPELRSRVRGFGADGVRQAQAEASQINLAARYGASTIEARVATIVGDLTTSPMPLIFGVFKVLILLFLFRAWRRRADAMLAESEQSDSSWVARASYYLRRIRSPLEWLILAWVLLRWGPFADVPGSELIFTACLWILGARIVIAVTDAVAARRNGRERPTDILRLRSLRLAGLVVAAVGLVLGWTRILVGRGAIFGWAITLCWVLVIPVIIVLVRWWRPHFWAALEQRPSDDAFANRTRGRPHNLFWTTIVGGYITWLGLMRFGVGIASRLDGTKALRSHLLRRQVARRATEDVGSRKPVNKLIYSRLDPGRVAEKVLSVEQAGVDAIRDLDGPALAVVVAPRGGGKSTQLARLGHVAGGAVVALKGPRDVGVVLAQLRQQLEAPDAELSDLAKDRKLTVLIDDAHQLVRPRIGGIDEVDRILELAREVGGVWVLAFDQWAWQYVSRARNESVFDYVHHLPKWEQSDIVTLLSQRTELASVKPNFGELVLPRQIDATDGELAPDEAYFRMLAEVSGGNPAVAIQFWRESLFVHNDDTVVRLFREPEGSEIESLASTVRYVLRTVLQLDWASDEELIDCSDLPPTDVRDAIRLALSRGYLKREADGVRVDWMWYRAVTGVLTRLNLLVSP
ncbi:MAG: hypothetical protein AB8H86_03385 [Polyangiales bacterium]